MSRDSRRSRIVISLTVDDAVADHPPSAKLVWLVLEARDEWVTMADLTDWTLLPESTTHHALARLIETGAVDQKQDFGDARRRRYRARTAGADAVDNDDRPVPGAARGEPRG